MTLLQHHLVALGLIVATTTALGLFILLKKRGQAVSLLFIGYMFAVAWWSAWELWGQFSPNEAVATIRLRAEYAGVSLIPTLFYHGILLLVGIRRQWELALSYGLSITFLVLIAVLRHPKILPDATPMAYLPFWGHAGPCYAWFLVFWIAVVVRALSTLWTAAWRADSTLRRSQLLLLVISSLVAYVGAVPEFIMKYGVQIPILNPFGLYLVPLHVICIAYAIVQFRLFDIHIVIRRSLVYSLVVTLLTVGYFGLVYGLEQAFRTTLGYHSFWVSVVAFALTALAFQPLKIGIQRFVDHLFFRASQQTVAKKLEVYEARAREGDRYKAVATLAAGIAHELKNPLTSIKTFLEFFPERHGDPAFRDQFLATVGSSVERLEQITHGLLDFSKPQATHTQPVDVKAVLDDVLALTRHELQKKALIVTTAYTHNGSVVQGDASKLKQCFLNLILNAKEAMASGGTLTIFTGAVNGHLEVHIADTGCGIHPKDLPHLFEPFFTKKAGGHGLGLSIVQSIVREHHGTITVASTPGRGTTFTVRLPVSTTP